MRKAIPLFPILLLCGIIACKKKVTTPTPVPPGSSPTLTYRGADFSFSPEILAAGTSFFSNGVLGTPISILRTNGINLVRLRLWHSPAGGRSGLAEVVGFAKIIKQQGLKLLLDLHYSDTWADPGNQTIPAAWSGLSLTTLADSVQQYTARVMQALSNENALPDMVQIGNETNSGMLWNSGKVGGSFDANWPNYALLIKRAIAGVRQVATASQTAIMLHVDGPNVAPWFFQNIKAQNVDYDIMGLSYYPFWDGNDLATFSSKVSALISTYHKKVFVVETAYPFSFGYNDLTNNIIGSGAALLPGYPATAQGQKEFLSALTKAIKALPEDSGLGFCYWAPEWVAFKGPTATNGSSWENMALFDFNNAALPAVSVFGQ